MHFSVCDNFCCNINKKKKNNADLLLYCDAHQSDHTLLKSGSTEKCVWLAYDADDISVC